MAHQKLFYSFPSAASSRNRRPAAQIALVPFNCVAFSPFAVLTFTVASSTAYDPRTTRPLNTVVISLQITGVATAHSRHGVYLRPRPAYIRLRRGGSRRISPSCRVGAEAVIRSVELKVQPDARDVVGEMGMRGGWPRGQNEVAKGKRAPCKGKVSTIRFCS
jgi:hypothetical protein